MLGKDYSNDLLHPIDIPVGYRFFSSSNRMGLPPLTYTVTTSPLWVYSFTTLSSSFPGTSSEIWSVPRVGKVAVTSARSFLLQKAHLYECCLDRFHYKYWGLKRTYYKILRAKKNCLIYDALFSPKYPILFLIQCLTYFHLFLGCIFPFFTKEEDIGEPSEQSR